MSAKADQDLEGPVMDPRLALAPILGIVVCFAVLAGVLVSRVQLFADGGFFAFAILSGDPWGVSFANIPARASAYVLTILPPLGIARLGYPEAAITLYGGLMGALPAAGLIATCAISGRTRLLFFCSLSTIVVVPYVVFFPSEMLVTHALFWPLLAAVTARPSPRTGLVAVLMPALAFSHEGGVVLLALTVAYLMASRRMNRSLSLIAVLTLIAWLGVKFFVPGPHLPTQAVLSRNSLMVLNPLGIIRPASVAIATSFCVFLLALSRSGEAPPSTRRLIGLALIALLPVAPIVAFSEVLLVERYDGMLVGRYNFRSLMLVALSLFMLILMLRALPKQALPAWLVRWMDWRPFPVQRFRDAVFGLMLVSMGGHLIEGGRFLWAWSEFSHQLTAIARGAPAPIPSGYDRLDAGPAQPIPRLEHPGRAWSTSWTWADPFLSVVLAMPQPARALVYQPMHGYVPLYCGTIRALDPQDIRLPAESMALITRYVCEVRNED